VTQRSGAAKVPRLRNGCSNHGGLVRKNRLKSSAQLWTKSFEKSQGKSRTQTLGSDKNQGLVKGPWKPEGSMISGPATSVITSLRENEEKDRCNCYQRNPLTPRRGLQSVLMLKQIFTCQCRFCYKGSAWPCIGVLYLRIRALAANHLRSRHRLSAT
jgi:hypothetical protein